LTDAAGNAQITTDEFLSEGLVYLVVTGNNILAQSYPVYVCNYWLGHSSDWNQPSNWFTGIIPDQNTRIIIPSTPAGGFWPETNTGPSRQCKSVLVESGATFSIQPGDTFVIQQQ
jgi:hypothetical protein